MPACDEARWKGAGPGAARGRMRPASRRECGAASEGSPMAAKPHHSLGASIHLHRKRAGGGAEDLSLKGARTTGEEQIKQTAEVGAELQLLPPPRPPSKQEVVQLRKRGNPLWHNKSRLALHSHSGPRRAATGSGTAGQAAVLLAGVCLSWGGSTQKPSPCPLRGPLAHQPPLSRTGTAGLSRSHPSPPHPGQEPDVASTPTTVSGKV